MAYFYWFKFAAQTDNSINGDSGSGSNSLQQSHHKQISNEVAQYVRGTAYHGQLCHFII